MKIFNIAFSTIISEYTLNIIGKQKLLDHPIYIAFLEKLKPKDTVSLIDFCKFLENIIDELKPQAINLFFGDYLYSVNKPVREIVEEFISTISCSKILTTFPICLPYQVRNMIDVFDVLLTKASINIIELDKFFDNFDLINFQYFGTKNKIHYMFTIANAITFANHNIAISRVAKKEEYKEVLNEFNTCKEVIESVKLNIIPSNINSYYFYKLLSLKYEIYVEPKKMICAFPKNEIYTFSLFSSS